MKYIFCGVLARIPYEKIYMVIKMRTFFSIIQLSHVSLYIIDLIIISSYVDWNGGK